MYREKSKAKILLARKFKVFGYMLQFPTRSLRYFVTCVIYSKEALDIHPTQVYWHQFLENESLILRKIVFVCDDDAE